MEPDTVASAQVASDAEVMASIEEGQTDTFIIADVSQDDSYLTMPLADAATLPEWR